jgi:hypothetical protein
MDAKPWEQWAARTAKPGNNPDAKKRGKCLDESLFAFAQDVDRQELRLPALKSVDRFWVHTRAAQLGLACSTATPGAVVSGMTLTKPSTEWRVDWSGVGATPVARPTRRDSAMDAWSTDCTECGQDLDAWSALYHHSGMGPLCQDCIDDDDELEGLKWEEKASFWR